MKSATAFQQAFRLCWRNVKLFVRAVQMVRECQHAIAKNDHMAMVTVDDLCLEMVHFVNPRKEGVNVFVRQWRAVTRDLHNVVMAFRLFKRRHIEQGADDVAILHAQLVYLVLHVCGFPREFAKRKALGVL